MYVHTYMYIHTYMQVCTCIAQRKFLVHGTNPRQCMRYNLIITRSSCLCVLLWTHVCIHKHFDCFILLCLPSLSWVIFVKMVPDFFFFFGNLLFFCLSRVYVFIMKILKQISEKQNSCTFAKKEKNRGSFFSRPNSLVLCRHLLSLSQW